MKTLLVLTLLCVAFFFPGCSMLTQSGRQEGAYARYVSKSSKGRVKQARLFHSKSSEIPVSEPSEPTISAGPVAVAENVP